MCVCARRERDELWSRCDELRSSLSAAVSERDDLMSKVIDSFIPLTIIALTVKGTNDTTT